MAEFKDRLEQALAMRNMRPSELSRLTGIGEGAISQYRKGAYKATQRNLEKISVVLGVSIPWLMGADDNKKPEQSNDELLRLLDDPANRALFEKLMRLSDDNISLIEAQIDLLKARQDKQ